MDHATNSTPSAAADEAQASAAPRPWYARLFARVDIASLVWFRIAFGLCMIVEVVRYSSKIARSYIEPDFHFTYYGFEWVKPWPGDGMYVHFGILLLAAICVTIGAGYRLAATVFFLGISYVFLLEQAHHLNHMYLICLISFVMILVPAHRAFSIDAWLRPRVRAQTAPRWALWLVRAQVGIPYVYAGIAKLNADWMQAQPLKIWLARRAERPWIGPILEHEWTAYFFAYGGLAFDLLVVPLMLWRRTRLYALAAALTFHMMNGVVFNIGIFPWVMAGATLIFFPPDWPRRVLDRVRARLGAPPAPAPERVLEPEGPPRSLRPSQGLLLGVLASYMAFQLLFPLRHWLYPGDVAWTEEGHKFSWRMKLRTKKSRVEYYVTDPVRGETWLVRPRKYVSAWQLSEMAGRPEMILELAHYLAARLRAEGREQVEIRVWSPTTVNHHPSSLLIDPSVDLTRVERSIRPASWILPMGQVTPDPAARRRFIAGLRGEHVARGSVGRGPERDEATDATQDE